MADDYRRLMMIKSPSASHQPTAGKRYTILSDNFSKINVKQAVALQSGLGQGGMLNRDLSKHGSVSRGAYGMYQAPGDAMGGRFGGPQKNIIQFTRDKRPVSSHNPSTGLKMMRKGGGPVLASRDSSLVNGYQALPAGPSLALRSADMPLTLEN